ncbi:MAG: hypothetical protein LBJ00_10245 [Planctomycetaceae bacterium]|jgi:hypothetical protein|nr:hypothetical protein [Planctomycetaceae bacterium]
MKRLETQSSDVFLESSGIRDTRQKDIALIIRKILAKNFGLPVNVIHSLAAPNRMLKLATRSWDDVDFITDIELELGIDYIEPIIEILPLLFTCKFFGFTLRQGTKTIGEWVNTISLECLHLPNISEMS